ncbi:MAG: hypothetical protein IPI21_02815 [Propionivibrio sp.]|nr:hypothetical protein [Propionivibrio sp.]
MAGFADGSRVQTLTHSLSFASALAHLCMVDEESRWSLLPSLLARAARLGIGGDALNDLVDRMVERWREWGAKLNVRTQDIPPFSEILAATPPMRRMGTVPDSENRRAHAMPARSIDRYPAGRPQAADAADRGSRTPTRTR